MPARWRLDRRVAALAIATLGLLSVWPIGARQAPAVVAADRFVDSVGVNVHLHYDHTLYKEQFELVRSRLLELGVRHVRDGLVDTTWQGYYDRHNQLGDAGIRGTFITSFDQPLAVLVNFPFRVVRSFEAYEAPNEPDRSPDPAWPDKLRASMQRLADVQRIAAVAHFPVIGPSMTDQHAYTQAGDIGSAFDAGNLHNYMAGRHPGTTGWGDDGYGSIAWNLRGLRRFIGDKPIVTTETGYQDAPDVPDSVPAVVAARYLPRLLLEQYRHGVTRTFLYELADFPGSGAYGLLHADGAPKPAYHAVKALLAVLADPGPAHVPRPLDYSASGPDTLRHMAFQKRDGRYYLALWLEEPSYDPPGRRSVGVSGRSATLRLPRPMLIAQAFRWQDDGTADIRPVRAVTASTDLDVSDQLLVLEIVEAGSGVAASPGAPGPLTAAVSGHDVHLRWQAPLAGSPPTIYRLEAAGEASFAAPLAMTLGAALTEFFVPAVPAGLYFARVRAGNAGGIGPPSPAVPVAVAVPGVPELVAEQVDANPITLRWRPGAGAPPEHYILSAGTAAGASDVAVVPLGQRTQVVTPVPVDVPFFVRVAAVNAHGAVRSNEVTFVVRSPAAPAAPRLHPPSVRGTTVTLSWTAVSGATSYAVVVRHTPGGPVVAFFPVPGQELTAADVPPGRYVVSIVGVRDGHPGPESAPAQVTVA